MDVPQPAYRGRRGWRTDDPGPTYRRDRAQPCYRCKVSHIWDHQPDLETLEDHAHFLAWCDLGADHRALRRLVKRSRLNYSDLDRLKREKCWRERYGARDAFIYAGRREASETSWDLHQRSMRTATEAILKATKVLAFELTEACAVQEITHRGVMSPVDAIRGIAQVARVLPGIAPATPEPDKAGALDLSNLTKEEQLQFRDLLGRVNRKPA